MLKLSKKSEYALMAAKYMALNNHGQSVTAKEIAESYKISYELVAKVLQNLVKREIIVSYQGSKGGYSLKKSPDEISLIELIQSVEPNYGITECLSDSFSKQECSYFDCCKIKDPLIEVQRKIDQVFHETKLSHII